MFILTVEGKKEDGAYAVQDDSGDKVLFMFEEEDDAVRYALMLEDSEGIEIDIIEVDPELAIHTCRVHNYKYTVITPNDIVVPPKNID